MGKIAIIGGGVAGGSAGLYLSSLGIDVTLFEQNTSLVSGPPFCHLHAGGNLYREIPDSECITLLHQSIDLLRFYPYGIDYRPTVVITPIEDEEDPKDLLPRLKKLQEEYRKSIEKDPKNKVLGEVEEYFKLYEKEDLIRLQEKEIVKRPTTLEQWMIPVAKNVDLDLVKFPFIVVQEYGLNLFRLSGGLNLQLENITNCNLLLNTKVTNVSKKDEKFFVTYINNQEEKTEEFDYLINSAGYKTGIIDDYLGYKRDRLVEFKAAYVTKWEECDTIWPEVIFHGKRGTPRGMGQFTPYPDRHFQLHGMTKDITLFDDGLVKSSQKSSYPELSKKFREKIDKSWCPKEVEERTKRAISHLSKYIPSFSTAKVAGKPLFGAQQIPGKDKELRAADVSFEGDRYARCEVVKASSVLDMIDEVMKKLIKLGLADEQELYRRDFDFVELDSNLVLKQAKRICQDRDYPTSLASINTTK
ncbi:MAG: FAD-dependent oxidoreductase [Campylobacterales bacterium]|nr:FAD-dependent oxidoreductase [Campylobacterales bacterium]